MRKEQELQEKFEKNADFEQILALMNTTLHEAEDELIESLPEHFPTIHIIGAPRSGTTLAVQLLAETLDIGYINNLIAAFWKAPLFGIALSKQLLDADFQSDYHSNFGRTDRIQEPHEFGYFWNYHLNYDDFLQKNDRHEESIDWDHLARVLKNMCRAFNKPILFKSFLLGFHSAGIIRHLSKSYFIYIRRNVIDNAMSILKMRRNYIGNVDEWGSMKPKQYSYLKNQDRYIQVVGQVLFLEYEYLKQFKQVPEANSLIIDYHDLCRQTDDILSNVNELISHHCSKRGEINGRRSIKLKMNKYDRNNAEVDKLEKAKQFLISEFSELNDLIERRNKNAIN